MSRVEGHTTVLGVIGWPIAHSRSPVMHNAAIEASDVDAIYVPFPVAPEHLADAVRGIRGLGIRGVNVTLPHKEAIMAHLDEVDADARAIGAVNTVDRDGERLVGLNTDAPGLVRSIEEAGTGVASRRVAVLGAGGAARAAVVGLARAGAASVTIAARRPAQAEALVEALGPAVGVGLEAAGFDALTRALPHTDLLVQATSATLGDGDAAQAFADSLPLHALPNAAVVVDLVYRPRQTAVLRAAADRGLHTIDGLGMLLHQGALAFERWTGQHAPLEAMKRALGY